MLRTCILTSCVYVSWPFLSLAQYVLVSLKSVGILHCMGAGKGRVRRVKAQAVLSRESVSGVSQGTEVLGSGAPRFEELIAKRVEVIEHETQSADLVEQIGREIDFVSTSLLEALSEAESHGSPSPTFLHDGVPYTVYAAQVHWGVGKSGISQTVLAVEKEIPEARVYAGNSQDPKS